MFSMETAMFSWVHPWYTRPWVSPPRPAQLPRCSCPPGGRRRVLGWWVELGSSAILQAESYPIIQQYLSIPFRCSVHHTSKSKEITLNQCQFSGWFPLKLNIIRSDVAVRSLSFIQNAPSTSGLAPLTLGSAGPAASSALGALKASPGMADIPVLWQLESMNISKYGDRQWNGMKWNVVEDWSVSHHLFYCLYNVCSTGRTLGSQPRGTVIWRPRRRLVRKLRESGRDFWGSKGLETSGCLWKMRENLMKSPVTHVFLLVEHGIAKNRKTLGYHHVPIKIAISVVGARRSACPSMARTASHSISFCLGATSATTWSAHSQHHPASGFLSFLHGQKTTTNF